jgi:hypothetical protein
MEVFAVILVVKEKLNRFRRCIVVETATESIGVRRLIQSGEREGIYLKDPFALGLALRALLSRNSRGSIDIDSRVSKWTEPR